MSVVAAKIGQPPPSLEAHRHAIGSVSLQSRVGLNAANFFLAEITGVVMPFLGAYCGSLRIVKSRSKARCACSIWLRRAALRFHRASQRLPLGLGFVVLLHAITTTD